MASAPTAGTLAPPRTAGPVAGAWKRTVKFARKRPIGAISGIMCIALVLIAVGGWTGVLLTHDPEVFKGSDRLLGFLSESRDGQRFYILGTDELGRDLYSRIVKGAQISIFFGLGVAAISTTLGTIIGLVSAYLGGTFDMIIQRLIDVVQTIPLLVLAIAVVSVTGPGVMKAFWILAFLTIPLRVRVVRGSVLSVREEVYVEAARSMGATNSRIMLRHIFPNVVAPIIVLTSYVVALAIVIEASLSFLGIGAQPPTPSWGAMLTGSGQTYFQTNPRLALLPGFAISLVVFASNMFGDSLRDELDPRLRGTR